MQIGVPVFQNKEANFLIELSGDQTELGFYEIESVLEAYNYKYEILDSLRKKFYLAKGRDWGFWVLSHRGAYIKNIWKILGEVSEFKIDEIKLEDTQIRLQYKNLDKEKREALIEEYNRYVSIIGKKTHVIPSRIVELYLIDFKDLIYLTYPIGSHRREIGRRNPRYRNYAPSATMDAYLSRALVNFSRAKPGDVFLDPFAGSGSIAMEASSIGSYTIALDKSAKHLLGLEINRRQFNLEIDIIVGDATNLPIRETTIDAIATDPPYGRSAATFKRGLKEIYNGFLREAARVLKRRKFLVFCAPKGLDVTRFIDEHGFELIKKLEMRVHNALTRVIYVLALT